MSHAVSLCSQALVSLQDLGPLSFVEIFAGQAEATRNFRSSSYKSARLDLLYMDPEPGKQNPMDLNSAAGFANLRYLSVGFCLIC